jgi:hypothetical protein
VDNLTHTLTAVAISQTGLNRKTRFATLTLILAANAPDIDVLSGLRGSVTYLEYHRGKEGPGQAGSFPQRPVVADCSAFGNR